MTDRWAEVERRWRSRRQLWSDCLHGIPIAGKSVLDAGTGEGHLTRVLAEQSPARLTSITLRTDEIDIARQTVGHLADRVCFEVADITSMRQIADDQFDLVVADFLIAAVASYTPYREVEAVEELARVTRPGGRLLMTGWEVGEGTPTEFEQRIRQLSALRDVADRLNDRRSFREFPSSWVKSRMGNLGLAIERERTLPDVHRNLDWLSASVRRAVESLDDGELREVLLRRVDRLSNEISSDPLLEQGRRFGQLYGVLGMKVRGGALLAPP